MCSLKRNQRNGKTEWIPFYQEVTLVALVSLVRNHEQTGTVAPSENGRLPLDLAHQLASDQENLICPNGSPDSVTY
jgi:hypothetical protein